LFTLALGDGVASAAGIVAEDAVLGASVVVAEDPGVVVAAGLVSGVAGITLSTGVGIPEAPGGNGTGESKGPMGCPTAVSVLADPAALAAAREAAVEGV
jgi:hypothetical protein